MLLLIKQIYKMYAVFISSGTRGQHEFNEWSLCFSYVAGHDVEYWGTESKNVSSYNMDEIEDKYNVDDWVQALPLFFEPMINDMKQESVTSKFYTVMEMEFKVRLGFWYIVSKVGLLKLVVLWITDC
jgi:hypothetical protein